MFDVSYHYKDSKNYAFGGLQPDGNESIHIVDLLLLSTNHLIQMPKSLFFSILDSVGGIETSPYLSWTRMSMTRSWTWSQALINDFRTQNETILRPANVACICEFVILVMFRM